MSDDQIQDALYVRRLYLTRRGLLALEKEALLQKIHQADPEQASAADHLQQAMDVTARLRAIAVEDYTAYLKVACALRRGVRRPACALLLQSSKPMSVASCCIGLCVRTAAPHVHLLSRIANTLHPAWGLYPVASKLAIAARGASQTTGGAGVNLSMLVNQSILTTRG